MRRKFNKYVRKHLYSIILITSFGAVALKLQYKFFILVKAMLKCNTIEPIVKNGFMMLAVIIVTVWCMHMSLKIALSLPKVK